MPERDLPARDALLKKIALSLASLAALAGLLESSGRLFLRPPAPVLLRDRIFLSALPLVNARPLAGEAKDSRAIRLAPRKDAGELRIFVFGESSVEGQPWGPSLSAVTFLHDRLVRDLPGRKVTVVNMGRAGSFTMDAYYHLVASMRFQPDFVIFYMGTNDRYDFEPEMCLPSRAPRLHAGWRILVERSVFLQAVRIMGPAAYARLFRKKGIPFIDGRPRCPPREAFQSWADILVDAASRCGARVIVASPVRNFMANAERWEHALHGTELEESLPKTDRDYRLILRCHLLRGCDAVGMLRRALAKRRWEESSLTADLRDAWRRSASRVGGGFIDFGAFLESVTPGGLATYPYIVDWVHLSPEGYWLLAGLWRAAVLESLGLPAGPGGPVPDLSRYRGAPSVREMERILVHQGFSWLEWKSPTMAAAFLRQAAVRYGSGDASLMIEWLQSKTGGKPLPPARASRARALLSGGLKQGP